LYVPIYTKSYLKNKNYSLKFWILIRRHFQRNYQLNDLGRKVWLSFENQKFVSSLFMYLYIHYTVQKILTILKHGPYLKMFKIRFWRTWRTGGERARWITLYAGAGDTTRHCMENRSKSLYNAPIITYTLLSMKMGRI